VLLCQQLISIWRKYISYPSKFAECHARRARIAKSCFILWMSLSFFKSVVGLPEQIAGQFRLKTSIEVCIYASHFFKQCSVDKLISFQI
jgi:hypothetical protein